MQEEHINRNKKAVFGWTMYDWANSVYSLAITTAIFPTYFSAVSKSKELMIRMDNNMSIVPFLGFEVPSVSLYSYAISIAYVLIVILSPILGAIADYSGSKKKFMMALVFSRIWVFGFLTRNAGYVTAERGNIALNKDAVDRAVDTINKDLSSFQIYVEGRRETVPYVFEQFKTGAYRIARQTDLEILPVTFKGTYEAMHGIVVGRAEITVFIDDPFPVKDEDYNFYIEHSKNIFTKNLKSVKNLKSD